MLFSDVRLQLSCCSEGVDPSAALPGRCAGAGGGASPRQLHHGRRLGRPPALHQRPQPPSGRYWWRYVCLFLHVFWLIWSSSVDYRLVLNELFHLHREIPTQYTPLQQSSFCQTRSSQPLSCQTLVCLQTTHLLHTNHGNQAWSFIPARVQTRFCRTTSSHGCDRNQQSDTWLDSVMTVFHTDVCAVRSIAPCHTYRASTQTLWECVAAWTFSHLALLTYLTSVTSLILRRACFISLPHCLNRCLKQKSSHCAICWRLFKHVSDVFFHWRSWKDPVLWKPSPSSSCKTREVGGRLCSLSVNKFFKVLCCVHKNNK